MRTESYKYYTWVGDDGYFHGQNLLSRSQIHTLVEHHKETRTEQFATIQDYDADGKVIGCPLYFDIDSPDLYEAHQTMQNLVDDLQCDDWPEPIVYISGSKGYHVIVPVYIRHPRCHEIAGLIAAEYCSELDTSVYRSRSMWRVCGSWNVKGQKHKTRYHVDSNRPAPSYCDYDLDCTPYLDKLPSRVMTAHKQVSEFARMPACLNRLWVRHPTEDEDHNQQIHVLSRYFNQCGLDADQASALFASHSFWGSKTANEYEKVIRSVYQSGQVNIGCVSGRDSVLLKQYCNTICEFNSGINVGDVLK